MPVGVRIEDLPVYGAVDAAKIAGDIFEVSKNSGTSGTPVYASDGSKRIRLDELAALINLISKSAEYWISPDNHTWKITIDNNGEFQKEDLGIL